MPNRLSPDVDAKVLDLYVEEGLGAVAIASSLGLGSTMVYKILARADIKRNRETRKTGRPGWRRFDAATEKEIAGKYEAGAARESLESEYGCSGDVIRGAVLRFGGKIRNRGSSFREFAAQDVLKMRKLWEKGVGITDIAKVIGATIPVIQNAIRSTGIALETEKRKKLRPDRVKGRRVSQQGYLAVKIKPDDPYFAMSDASNYVMEHRLVMAQALGRCLLPTETVHHINGDKADNRPENLQVRQGNHGKHVAFCCADCGSRNIIPAPLGAT